MKISSENYQEITEFLRFVSNKAAKKIVEIYYNLANIHKKMIPNYKS